LEPKNLSHRINISKDVSDIFDACASAVIVLSQEGIIVFANQAIKAIFGYQKHEILDKNISILIPEEYRQRHGQLVEGFHQKPKSRTMGRGLSFPGWHKQQRIVPISISLKPLYLRDEQFTVATINEASLFSEMTSSLAKSEKNLQNSIEENKQLLAVAEHAQESVLLLDPQGFIKWHNKGAEDIFANVLNTGLEQSFLSLANRAKTEEDKKAWELIKHSMSQGLSTQQDLKVQGKSRDFVLQISVHPVFEQEKLQGFTVFVKDLTQQRRLELQLKESNDILETTARIASLGFYSLDIKSNKLTWSEEVYNIHDLPIDSPIEVEQALKFYAPQALPVITDAVNVCMQTGEPFDLELPFITAKQREIWVRAVGYADFENGEPVKLKGAFQDITYMRQAAIEANQAMRAKSAFLANMSHELRTPINGIVGLADIMNDTDLSEKQREYNQMTAQNAQALLYLVNQVLDYSKLEANKLGLRMEAFSLADLLEETLYIHRLEAKKKQLTFSVSIDESLPKSLTNDQDRLKQIIHNLCSNALKFTERGSIVVNISNLDNARVKFEINDTGIGIKPEDQKKLFVEFQQLDNSFSRKYGGTGLGLTIVKQLVSLMGGELGMQSEENGGSTFWFTIPMGNIPKAKSDALQPDSFPDALVLVKDFEQQKIWRELAQTQGLVVEPLTDVSTLLRLLKEEYRWKLIIIASVPDSLPLQTLVASVERFSKPQQHLCALDSVVGDFSSDAFSFIIPSSSEKEDALFIIEAVSNYYAQFLQSINQSLEGKHLLLAEDNEINQVVCREMLESVGARVTIVEDGTQVMATLQSPETFDAIIMDCQMPILDGYQTSMMIRHHNDENIRQHKIIAATAHGLQEDILRCYDVGMEDVLIKPFTRSQLIEVLARNL
jgi:PAS domain S-box-containing protein